jgi:hypothetical protein
MQSQISKSQYQKIARNTGIEKSLIGLVKISPFKMKKFEINEPIRYKILFQQSVFEISQYDNVEAKKYCLSII